ncbi:ShET2/EspL2 family type III secretion system effector toxin [Inquilinus sp. CA228]|uniref:ShET2/EspL2 family type III secretion system effector toxin n=1 Tax=Inquilinus sp. CA228 TaxID=3455609 RepID=UPI003F8D3F09
MANRSKRLTLAEWLFLVTEANPELLGEFRPDPPGRDLPPYVPRRAPRYVPSGRPRVNFNGQVQDGENPIVCRHFAYAYFESPDKADFLEKMQEDIDIWANFDGRTEEIEKDTNDLANSTPETAKHIVDSENFGFFIGDIAKQMRTTGVGSSNILLTTSLHQMAVNISMDAGDPEIHVKIYDPNITTDDNEFVFYSADDMQDIVFTDLVQGGEQYFGRDDRSMMAMCKNIELEAPSALTYIDTGDRPAPSQAFVMTCALTSGLPSVVRALGQTWAGHEKAVLDLGLLLALNRNGHPALEFAAQNGQAEAMKAWAEILRNLELTKDERLNLVRHKNANEVSAFFVAMEHGDENSVRAMGEIWEMLGFHRDDIVAMMNETDTSGRSAPLAAMHNDKDKCGAEYFELMKRFGIKRSELSLL